MPRYLISFDNASMTFPDEDLAQVSLDSHADVRALIYDPES